MKYTSIMHRKVLTRNRTLFFFSSRMRRISHAMRRDKWDEPWNYFFVKRIQFRDLNIKELIALAYSVRQDKERSGNRSVNVCTRQEKRKRKWKWMEVDWRRTGGASGVLIKNVERVAHARRDGADVIKSKGRPDAARGNNQLLAVYEDASWFWFCALKKKKFIPYICTKNSSSVNESYVIMHFQCRSVK